MSKVAIWSQVEKTDPQYTKSVSKGGGFSITAIDAQSQIMKATEIFGPFGLGWGVNCEHFKFEHFGDDIMLLYTAEMFYTHDGQGGRLPLHSTLIINRETRSGRRLDDECYKKVATDALTKGLSKLGFNADVFLGRFDDNRYVQQRKNEVAQEEAEKTPPPKKPKQNQATASDKMMEVGKWADKIEKDSKKRRLLIAGILCEKCERWQSNKPTDITTSILLQNVREDEYDVVIAELKKMVEE